MNYAELQKIFNRAFLHSFSKRKLLFAFIVLLCCGLLVVFSRGLATHAGQWTSMSLVFLPIFICTSLLLAMGVVLIRLYHDEVKKQDRSLKTVFTRSWELIIGTAYLTLPLILLYILLWMVLGIFFLLREIPSLGSIIGVILAFAPFLLIFGSLVLAFLNIALLFFATPAIALQQARRVIPNMFWRLKKDVLGNIILFVLALIPMKIVASFLVLAAILTDMSYLPSETSLQIVLQWFFIMVPFTLILSPAVVFFFNFAAEAHVLLRKS